MKRPYPLSYYFLLSLTALITSYPAQAQKDPDIEILEAAHVRTTGSALLEYVAKHTGNDADLLRIPQLLAALDDEQFSHREKAHKVLVALGPPAHAALLRAARNSTGETSTRARICAEAIHKSWQIWERRAAVRRLLALSPHGTVQTLLRFLPYAADTELEEEIWFGIYKRIKAQPDLLAVVQTNLRDVSPVRRALAACIVGKLGNRQQRFVAEALLEDPSADVRLRAAQGLLAAGETKAIPTLIDLLDMPDTTICWQAEELLHWVAGEDSPEAIIGAGSRSSRRSCKSSWQVWWSKHGKDVDLARPQAQGRRPGLFLADENVYPDDRSRKETGLAWPGFVAVTASGAGKFRQLTSARFAFCHRTASLLWTHPVPSDHFPSAA